MAGKNSGSFSRIGPARARAKRERMMVVGGGSVIFALLVLTTLLLTNRSDVDATQDMKLQPQVTDEIAFGTVVLVAPKVEVVKGTKLSRVELSKVYWPRDQVPEGAVREAENIREMYAKANLPANQPILRSGISATLPSYGIMESLPPGHRAASIDVDATSGVEGWATPGAHVDVLLTYIERETGLNTTRVVVEDAIVLSFDGSTKVNKSEKDLINGRSAISGSTVTLMVSLEDSLELQTARAMGKINLVLRNVNDTTTPIKRTHNPNDWKNDKAKRNNRKLTKGIIRMSDKDGKTRTLTLKDGEQNWWESDETEDNFGD